jgi:hypothetical protein
MFSNVPRVRDAGGECVYVSGPDTPGDTAAVAPPLPAPCPPTRRSGLGARETSRLGTRLAGLDVERGERDISSELTQSRTFVLGACMCGGEVVPEHGMLTFTFRFAGSHDVLVPPRAGETSGAELAVGDTYGFATRTVEPAGKKALATRSLTWAL